MECPWWKPSPESLAIETNMGQSYSQIVWAHNFGQFHSLYIWTFWPPSSIKIMMFCCLVLPEVKSGHNHTTTTILNIIIIVIIIITSLVSLPCLTRSKMVLRLSTPQGASCPSQRVRNMTNCSKYAQLGNCLIGSAVEVLLLMEKMKGRVFFLQQDSLLFISMISGLVVD